MCFLFYSVLNASTGSFFAAKLAGINPEIIVKIILINIKSIAPQNGKCVKFGTSVIFFIITLIGIFNKRVIKIPIIPELKPNYKCFSIKYSSNISF